MNDWKQKLKMRLPALLLLAATLLFWGFYDRYELVGPVLLQAPTLADASRIRGDCTETNGRFFLNVPVGGKTAGINFPVPEAESYAIIRVRGRMKVAGVVEGKNAWNCGRLLLVQYDAQGKWIPGHHGIVSERGDKDWERYEDVFERDPRAARADVVIEQSGVAGRAEFDRIVAEPVRLRPSFNRWRLFFAGLWIFMGGLYFRRCRLHRRKLRLLILLNAIAILTGTLMPGKWIEASSGYVHKALAKTIEKPAQSKPAAATSQSAVQKKDSESVLIDQFNEVVGRAHGVGHFVLFASLCFLVYLSAALEGQHRSYYLKVALDILLFAGVTESLQHLTLDRTAGIMDWLNDARGMLTAFLLFLATRAIWLVAVRARRRPVPPI